MTILKWDNIESKPIPKLLTFRLNCGITTILNAEALILKKIIDSLRTGFNKKQTPYSKISWDILDEIWVNFSSIWLVHTKRNFIPFYIISNGLNGCQIIMSF